MEFAATFGSLGDIIAVCQLTIQLSRALGIGTAQASASAKEYQELRKELDIFTAILVNVVATYEHYSSPSLDDFDRLLHTVVQECHDLIQSSLNRLVPKYHDSLKPEGSGSRIRDGIRKVEWSVREKERVKELRDKLRTNGQRISILTQIVSRNSARTNNETLLFRIGEVQGLISKHDEHQDALMKHMYRSENVTRLEASRIQDMEQSIQTLTENSNGIMSFVTNAVEGIIDLRRLLESVAETVVHIRAILSTPYFMKSLDPTRDMPIFLSDALGRKIDLPLELLVDWESLNTVLGVLFKSQKGYLMVLNHQFAIEDHCSGKDIKQDVPLQVGIRRGMRIDMSMVFTESQAIQGSCPRCHTITDAPENITIQCQTDHCGMWFRILQSDVPTTKTHYSTPSTEKASGKQASNLSVPVEPSDFQRVRMMNKISLTPTSTVEEEENRDMVEGSNRLAFAPAPYSIGQSSTSDFAVRTKTKRSGDELDDDDLELPPSKTRKQASSSINNDPRGRTQLESLQIEPSLWDDAQAESREEDKINLLLLDLKSSNADLRDRLELLDCSSNNATVASSPAGYGSPIDLDDSDDPILPDSPPMTAYRPRLEPSPSPPTPIPFPKVSPPPSPDYQASN
ncbi:hypothetical protein SCAR479_13048 [Seiridium cardinale]|uniref:Ubiquitin-like domain-containing protein n=1 Tax=Seiridium cardinale TaxID=138064 RepID=A0ABR2X965_9PEZI